MLSDIKCTYNVSYPCKLSKYFSFQKSWLNLALKQAILEKGFYYFILPVCESADYNEFYCST